ncbi:MAG: PA0069 family radical SAM protein [Alphaproteobacteria bacterium]
MNKIIDRQLTPDAGQQGGIHNASPDRIPDRHHPGRGAISNRAGRFERLRGDATDDGWRTGCDDYDDPPRLETSVTFDRTKTIIARNDSPDLPFDRSINAYRGCEHGCVYCFARPTHAWLGLSPGLDFETRLFAKPNAAELLTQELSKPGYKPRTIAMGTNTDPYQPVERRLKITRSVLEVLAAHDHPVSIVTKSALVTRDLDILGPMAAKGIATVGVSVTTLDSELAQNMEPRAARPERRLETIRMLAAAGLPVTVMAAPMIPALNDHELEAILIRARQAGATHASYILLRLPLELKDLFEEWLATHYPDRKRRVLGRLREMRGGALYKSGFGERMRGTGEVANLLRERFKIAVRQQGYSTEPTLLDAGHFRSEMPDSSRSSKCSGQLNLFAENAD